jgi:hypothetical protein
VYTYIITATDADANDLTYSAVTKPSWLTFMPGTHLLSGMPSSANVGANDVKLSVTDGIATVNQTFTIIIGASDITNVTSGISSIYPNPASGIVNFEFANVLDNGNLKIFTMNGRLVKEVNLSNQKSITLDISDLKSDGYIYLLTTNDGYQTGKFIVK